MTTADKQVPPTAGDSPKAPAPRWPRLWPALVLVLVYWTGWLVMNKLKEPLGINPFAQFMFNFWAPMITAVLMLVWVLALSRLKWLDRLWFVGCLTVGGLLALYLVDRSVVFGLIMNGLPMAMTAVVVWLVLMRGSATWPVRAGVVAASLLAWGYQTLVRIDGIDGDLVATTSWRWEKTKEERYLMELTPVSAVARPAGSTEHGETTPTPAPDAPDLAELTVSADDWPEFRGALRDGAVRGVRISRDWEKSPPRELWRRRVGPGWSSFVTIGDVAFTQEQRGEEEAAVALDIASGQEIWSHTDQGRFWEVVAGAGPRSTPTFAGGKLYTQGASGTLDCLDAATGNVVWSRDIKADAGVKDPPQWGYSSSPLVASGVVVAFAGGKDKGLVAYDALTGEPKWQAGKATHTYSSPQLFTAGDILQVLLVSDRGLESLELATGKLVWEHPWEIQGMFRVSQPHVVGDKILLCTGMSNGSKLLTVAEKDGKWEVSETWFTKEYSPYFNDGVSHDGFLYGFDGPIFMCLDLATGKKQWKKGRYGHGQVLLVADQGLLVVISEKGELVLLEANPKQLVELGKLPALANKTWNHPVITGNRLLIRNDEEMACYELAPE
jgi:outer membrane protein assembly factor BamB